MDKRALDATLVVKCSHVQSPVLTTGPCHHPTPIRVGRITGPPHLTHKDRLPAAVAQNEKFPNAWSGAADKRQNTASTRSAKVRTNTLSPLATGELIFAEQSLSKFVNETALRFHGRL
jgi:hypothetical protein